MPISLDSAIPSEYRSNEPSSSPTDHNSSSPVLSYVLNWRNQLRTARWDKRSIWDECWQLYRGVDDFSSKEPWQTKIVLPKAFSSVKQATSVIKRLLSTAKKPYSLESVNPDDLQVVLRAEQMTDLTKFFMEKAKFVEEFAEGLECGFIIGIGIWKEWWGLKPRTRTRVITQPTTGMGSGGGMFPGTSPLNFLPGGIDPKGDLSILGQSYGDYNKQLATQFPTQLPQEDLDPRGWPAGGDPTNPIAAMMGEGGMGGSGSSFYQEQKSIIREEILEGQLFIRAVDPYNFYWLPGSKLNRWVGTIEDVELSRWELLDLADQGVFDRELVERIQPMKIDEQQQRRQLRFNERVVANQNGPSTDTGMVKLTEFYGPIVIDGKIIRRHGHVIIANDSVVLVDHDSPLWCKRPPYIGFSPLALPFRTEGVGLVEAVREIDRALSKLSNLSVDTLLFRLLPVFEVTPEVFENPEDFETGFTPGKILRRNMLAIGQPGINPVQFEDVSSGAMAVQSALDRFHQEGAMVGEIQEGLPRWRGAQTATETQLKQTNQDTFFGNMAADIEAQAIAPMVELAMELIMQFIDTANDPRVASILGINGQTLAGMTREELMEMIQGEYKVKVTGISEQLGKAEMLQNLVQLMNLIGQNAEAWLPYVNQSKLLQRILECFRPMIHDLEDVIADEETARAKQAMLQNQSQTADLMAMMPQLIQMATAVKQQQAQSDAAQQQAAAAAQSEQQGRDHEVAMEAARSATAPPTPSPATTTI